MSIVVVNTARLSFNLAYLAFKKEPSRRYTPRILRPAADLLKKAPSEISAFHPGDAEIARRSERLKDKTISQDIADCYS